MSSKEIAHVFRYARMFAKVKGKPEVPAASRYTNFTLSHAWEKYDCQTQLLCREALLPSIKLNPEIVDADIDNMGGIRLSLEHARASALK